MNINELVRKHALKNAFDYGKANPGSVAGKVVAEFPDAKKDMKSTMQLISKIISEVNKLKKEELDKELSNYTFIEKPKEEKKGFEIKNAENGKVLTRFPPEPSGYPHIGHAKAAFLDYEIAKQYNGKMILRFDDTNPEKESQEYVDAIKDGLKWLGISWDKESYTSDHMSELYTAAEKLISIGKAYVCTCSQEEISKQREQMKPCACRALDSKENLIRWKDMLAGKYEEGKIILRFKGDFSALNTVMRDPSLARIIMSPHYKQKKKYIVWPSYDLAVVVMDALEGITHPMRSKEYELRDELYNALFDALGYKRATMIGFSRLQIKNAPISKRLLTPLVKENKVLGWDDPRLPTLKGLARRGILPEAIKNFVLSFGLSKVESEPTLEALLVENKKFLDPVSKHYFFVPDPVKIKIKNAPVKTVVLKVHSKDESLGTREIEVGEVILIPKGDFDSLKDGEIFRLKDLYNVKLLNKKKKECEFLGDGLVEKKIQWVTKDSPTCEILVPKDLVDSEGKFNPNSLEIVKGLCEVSCTKLKEGEVVQFERFGFCRLDRKDRDKLTFVYSC